MQNKASSIGEFIKVIAESKNLKPSDLGKKINTSKQNVSDIYKRITIDTELLLALSKALDFNLFSYYDDKEPVNFFRNQESLGWQLSIEKLTEKVRSLDKLVETQEELLSTQRKYIIELENKLKGGLE